MSKEVIIFLPPAGDAETGIFSLLRPGEIEKARLSVEGGGFRGGGLLQREGPNRFGGVIELDFQGLVTVDAVVLIDLDRQSVFLLISSEFTPIQLSFGFTLNGVGGMIGLNRSIDTVALRLGVYDGSLNSILFPADVLHNADRIISDAGRIFPPADGHFIFGPMIKAGWGTPSIITLELGLILDLPDIVIALIGAMRLSVPAREAPLVNLQLNFAGILDIPNKQLSFDASLIDSYIVKLNLTGDLSLRLYWGQRAAFILTAGGFHPDFVPPPVDLPALRRLSAVLFRGNPDVRFDCYVAATANTFQVGGEAHFYCDATVGYMEGLVILHVLVQYNPFYFSVKVKAKFSAFALGHSLLGFDVDVLVEGPAQWHIQGRVTITLIHYIVDSLDVSISFDERWGEQRTQNLPPVDVFQVLTDELGKAGHWRIVLPPNTSASVRLRDDILKNLTGELVLHPFGSLEIRQQTVPLRVTLSRFGTGVPAAHKRFDIPKVQFGNGPGALDFNSLGMIAEQFAPAQFFDLPEGERLNTHFRFYDAGVQTTGSDKARATYRATLRLGYEVVYIPDNTRREFYFLDPMLFVWALQFNAASKSALSEVLAPGNPLVDVPGKKYAVVSSEDLHLHDEQVFSTPEQADDHLNHLLGHDPGLQQMIQVMRL